MKAFLLSFVFLAVSCAMMAEDALNEAIASSKTRCEAVKENEGIAMPFLGLGTAQGSETLAFERAATEDCLLGQIKLIPRNSLACTFVWGLNIAANDPPQEASPTIEEENVPIHSADALLAAGQRLLGIKTLRRFTLTDSPLPEIAGKQHLAQGPCQLWAAIALAEGETEGSPKFLLLANCGSCPQFKSGKEQGRYFENVMKELGRNALREAKEKGLGCKKLYVSFRETWVPEGNIGCAIAAMPKVKLAKDAIPTDGASKLSSMTLSEWEADRKLRPLPAFEE